MFTFSSIFSNGYFQSRGLSGNVKRYPFKRNPVIFVRVDLISDYTITIVSSSDLGIFSFKSHSKNQIPNEVIGGR